MAISAKPFAALTGYDSILSEAARVTDQCIEFGKNDMEILGAKL